VHCNEWRLWGFGPDKRATYEVRLEELHAGLNADFGESILVKERSDQHRFEIQRSARELDNSLADQSATQMKHTKQTKH